MGQEITGAGTNPRGACGDAYPQGGMPVDLVRIADMWEENQEYLKQHLGQSRYAGYGAKWVLMAHAPYPKFNHTSKVRVHPDEVASLVAESRQFFRLHGLPGCCIMTTPATEPADLTGLLYRMGFMAETSPVMIFRGQHDPPTAPGITVQTARPQQIDLVFDLIRAVFFPEVTEESARWLRRGMEISVEIGAINYVAYRGRQPVGVGSLFVRDGMGGIYNMGTLPHFRGCGVATSVMAACLADARRLGCAEVGLTPTPMGRPLYERLGFEEVYHERYFVERF